MYKLIVLPILVRAGAEANGGSLLKTMASVSPFDCENGELGLTFLSVLVKTTTDIDAGQYGLPKLAYSVLCSGETDTIMGILSEQGAGPLSGFLTDSIGTFIDGFNTENDKTAVKDALNGLLNIEAQVPTTTKVKQLLLILRTIFNASEFILKPGETKSNIVESIKKIETDLDSKKGDTIYGCKLHKQVLNHATQAWEPFVKHLLKDYFKNDEVAEMGAAAVRQGEVGFLRKLLERLNIKCVCSNDNECASGRKCSSSVQEDGTSIKNCVDREADKQAAQVNADLQADLQEANARAERLQAENERLQANAGTGAQVQTQTTQVAPVQTQTTQVAPGDQVATPQTVNTGSEATGVKQTEGVKPQIDQGATLDQGATPSSEATAGSEATGVKLDQNRPVVQGTTAAGNGSQAASAA